MFVLLSEWRRANKGACSPSRPGILLQRRGIFSAPVVRSIPLRSLLSTCAFLITFQR